MVCKMLLSLFIVIWHEHVNCFLPQEYFFPLSFALLLRTFEDSYCTHFDLTKFLSRQIMTNLAVNIIRQNNGCQNLTAMWLWAV